MLRLSTLRSIVRVRVPVPRTSNFFLKWPSTYIASRNLNMSLRLHDDFEGALVRITAIDAKDGKMGRRNFYSSDDGGQSQVGVGSGVRAASYAASGSGIHFFPKSGQQHLVVTVASVLSPFLKNPVSVSACGGLGRSAVTQKHDTADARRRAFLVDSAHVTVSFEAERFGQQPIWKHARVIDIVDILPAKREAYRVTGDLKHSSFKSSSVSFATLAVLEVIEHPHSENAETFKQNACVSSAQSSARAFPLNESLPLQHQFRKVYEEYSKAFHVQRGQPISIISSPFGLISPAVFRNTLSTGSISNIVHESKLDGDSNLPANKSQVLFLTDAAIFPGSEGGAAVTYDGLLCGIVAPPLKRKNGTCVELAAIIPLNMRVLNCIGIHQDVLREPTSLVASFHPEIKLSPRCFFGQNSMPQSPSISEIIVQAQRSLVCVRLGMSWGSGIVTNNEGYIITCAHLVQSIVHNDDKADRKGRRMRQLVMVRFDGSSENQDWHEADVLFCSQGTLDLACLKLRRKLPNGVVPANLAPHAMRSCDEIGSDADFEQGSRAIILGHALFDPRHSLSPTVAVGSIAKLIPYKCCPMILGTSASVFRGDSGGMVVSGETGRVIGMITSNARQTDSGIIPKLNFSIPSTLLAPKLDDSMVSTRKAFESWFVKFEELSSEPQLKRLWDLQNTEENTILQLDMEHSAAKAQPLKSRI